MYCTYLTIYSGNLMPKRYLGSSSIKRIESGYRGSVCSEKWKDIWLKETRNNPHLFKTRILKTFKNRQDALDEELRVQKQYNIIRSDKWINEAYAQINGYAGRDVSGSNNPMYGNGYKMSAWCANNPNAASERNRKAALTQWSNDSTRARRMESMRGKKKNIKMDQKDFLILQREKAQKAKLATATRIEYSGCIYLGWNELLEKTGVTKHMYKKYYKKGGVAEV